MRAIALTLLLLLPLYSSGKKKETHPKAEIRVSYNYHETFVRGSDGVAERDYEFILLSNTEQSKFYPPISEYLDSLDSTPAGKDQYEQMLSAVMPEVVRTGNYMENPVAFDPRNPKIFDPRTDTILLPESAVFLGPQVFFSSEKSQFNAALGA